MSPLKQQRKLKAQKKFMKKYRRQLYGSKTSKADLKIRGMRPGRRLSEPHFAAHVEDTH